MSQTSWMSMLLDAEKELGEKIIAVAISEIRGKDKWSRVEYPVHFEEDFEGIENTNLEIRHHIIRPFDNGFGGPEGSPFTAWTVNWVIFPTEYDGSEGISWTRRNPCPHATEHV